MDDPTPGKKVTAYRLTPAMATKRIRALAARTDDIDWSNHALERMEEREIFDVDVVRTMRGGEIAGEPEPARLGEWKCKFVRQVRGGRSVGVVVIILQNNRLLVKTVEWEDLT